MKIVFATSNPNKIIELQRLIPSDMELLGLKDIGCTEDVPEEQDTIEGNAIQKARYVYENYLVNCFAEDTGLEIRALDGAPGVYSARYAGEQRNADDNMNLVLEQLKTHEDRTARFKTVIALILDGQLHTFEGVVNGEITYEKKGDGGFGYDPVFQPDGYDATFGELPLSEKNKISHRARATRKLLNFLSEISH
ncbi:MAG: non-canonical purine NTP diphosphatase [Bacteroidia bacterium]|nr:non-canonical purine NTP diphosphatase [Bacteroidia bacterium]